MSILIFVVKFAKMFVYVYHTAPQSTMFYAYCNYVKMISTRILWKLKLILMKGLFIPSFPPCMSVYSEAV